MPQAAIPAIGMGISAIGSILGSNKSAPPPGAIFPGLQGQYLQGLQGMSPDLFAGMKGMMQTGMSTDIGPMFESLVASQKRFQEQGAANILEQYGSAGLRQGSGVLTALGDYQNQLSKDYGNTLANYVFQASEAARGRQMQALGLGSQMVGAPAMAMYPTQFAGPGMASTALGQIGGLMGSPTFTGGIGALKKGGGGGNKGPA